jgi:hypothetical protein
MIKRTAARVTALATVALGSTVAAAAPAFAGGIGDFLSPAFGTSCANLNNGARAEGATAHGIGAAGGNLAGLPVGSPFNQCGGADMLVCFPGFNILSGSVLDSSDVPQEVLAAVDMVYAAAEGQAPRC